MRTLVLGAQQRAAIKTLMQYAENNFIPLEKMYLIAEGKLPPMGDFDGYSLNIPIGVRVVYTVEEHPTSGPGLHKGARKLKHLSVSVANEGTSKGSYPHPVLVDQLLEAFHFRGRLESGKLTIYTEEHVCAVNVLEEIKDA